jgi:hypothetical protein
MASTPLYRTHELAFRTLYAELKERVRAAGELLPGTPGSLALRAGTGHAYWYRVFNSVPGKTSETLVGPESDAAALAAMRERIAFSEWVAAQVPRLRKLGFQVADKQVARVLVELHNRGAFAAGLTLVGTLGYMAWLNEYGAMAITARTQDVDLARGHTLKLAAPLSILEALAATDLPFQPVPGIPSSTPSTSFKLPGHEALRVDVLAPGKTLGAIVRLPELEWAAQTVPHYDYLLDDPEEGSMLAGWQCIPVRLPQPGRFVWHKLYASLHRPAAFAEKAKKDRLQAVTLAAVLQENEPMALEAALSAAPKALVKDLRKAVSTWFEPALAATSAGQEMRDLIARA